MWRPSGLTQHYTTNAVFSEYENSKYQILPVSNRYTNLFTMKIWVFQQSFMNSICFVIFNNVLVL